MDLDTFIVATYCLVEETIDEALGGGGGGGGGGERLRLRRGPAPKLSDVEVLLTIELLGEFLGIDTDKAIHLFFRRHYAESGSRRSASSIAAPSPGRRPTS